MLLLIQTLNTFLGVLIVGLHFYNLRGGKMDNNIMVKEYSIKLDGKVRKLRLDFKAMEHIEENYGNVFDVYGDVAKKPFSTIPKFLHSTMIHEDPDLTIDQVKSWLPGTIESVNMLCDLITDMVMGVMPASKESEEESENQTESEESEEKNVMTNPTE